MKKIIFLLCAVLCIGCASKPNSLEVTGSKDATCRQISYYDYGSPVPTSQATDNWFTDAIVIGDMRAGSLALYSDLAGNGAEIIYEEVLGVYSMKTTPVQMSTSTPYDILLKSDKKKIYLWLGLNEIAYDVNDWANAYSTLVQEIINSHKDAQIYLLGEYNARSISALDSNTLSSQIQLQNEAMQKIAKDYRIYYIDLTEALNGSDGMIDSNYIWGGYSLNPDGAQKVSDLLSTHIVSGDDHVKTVCE